MSYLPAAAGFCAERTADSKALIVLDADQFNNWCDRQDDFTRNWLASQSFKGRSSQFLLLPEPSGHCQRVVVLINADEPYGIAHLPKLLPAGNYHRCPSSRAALSADNLYLGWGLGAYRFERYLSTRAGACLHSEGHSLQAEALLAACLQTRDLINTPAQDMGPEQLESAMRELATAYSADFKTVVGEQLLTEHFPTIHAVGRAATRTPRMIRLDWGDAAHPHLVLCGKGVCFDTGGLDMKASAGMRNMKKDMGGAAHALALAGLVMQAQLPVRLSLLIAAVENNIAGDAFRPGDIIRTRQGLSVEIHNTDAEGRLVLCDLLSLACESKPDLIMDFATLTGAARIALGPDLPVLYSNRDALAEAYMAAGAATHDPLWRLPLWQPYRSYLKSSVADLSNASAGTHAGSITAALFLQCFVKPEIDWMHLDVYSWNDAERPGRPAGGEAQGLRAAFAYLQAKYDNRHSP
jgi:leucyl aminopeptidase